MATHTTTGNSVVPKRKNPILKWSATDVKNIPQIQNAAAISWQSGLNDFKAGNYMGAAKDLFAGKEARQIAMEMAAIWAGLMVLPPVATSVGLTRMIPAPKLQTVVYAGISLMVLNYGMVAFYGTGAVDPSLKKK